MRGLALRLRHRRCRLLELELPLDELEHGAVLAVQLRDLADALGESPLARGELPVELGNVIARACGGRGRVTEAVA